MCGVVVMTVIDLAIVNTALPSIQTDLGAEPADLQWVVVIYGIFVAGFLLLGGRMGDLAGHRRVLMAGVAILAAASLVGGLAGSLEVLIAARAAQGLGAALAAPNALAVLSNTFAEGPERNRAMGIFGAAGGSAAAFSAVLGGLLVQGPGWPWAFFINVPVGIVLFVLLARMPAEAERPARARADATGAIALTLGMMAVAFGVHETIEYGWVSWQALLPLLGGLALLGGFVVHEGRASTPLIPLRTLRKPSLLWANVAAGLLWASFLGLIYQATLFMQQVQGYSPLASGAATLPIAFVSLFDRGAGGSAVREPDRRGADDRARVADHGRGHAPALRRARAGRLPDGLRARLHRHRPRPGAGRDGHAAGGARRGARGRVRAGERRRGDLA